MPALEITIPTTSTVNAPSTYTVYHLTLRLPLRTFTVSKRYSEFAALHAQLTSEAGNTPPPAPLPPKTYLADTLKHPLSLLSHATPPDSSQVETRRQGLEAYLRAINDAPDPRWRNGVAWRTFLNLPASVASSTRSGAGVGGLSGPSSTSTLHAALTAPREPIADPVAWLDTHRELKALLHATRASIASRDAGGGTGDGPGDGASPTMLSSFSGALDGVSPVAAHEAAASAKKQLVRAAALLKPLEQGLQEHGSEWSRKRLGEGEVRRRKDLLAAAKHDMASLESLVTLVRRKGEVDGVVEGLRQSGAGGTAASSDAQELLSGGGGGGGVNGRSPAGGVRAGGLGPRSGKGRVLGKETARTRERDNSGVLQLQSEVMKEQDADLEILEQVLRRQRQLGEQINVELREQSEMLDLLEEDVDRVGGKIKVAKKRADNIS